MHRSRLGGFIIDCKTEDLDAAARFWGEALGLKIAALGQRRGQELRRLRYRAQ